MSSLQPFPIIGYPSGGLILDRKPFLLPETGFSKLENAYVWRQRVKKREGLVLVGQLRRVLTAQALGNTGAGVTTITFANILTTIGITGEANASIEPGSLVITVGAPDTATFTDQGDGTFAVTGAGLSAGSYVNYATKTVVINFTAPTVGGAAMTAAINYFPGLPVMGIYQREISSINDEQTIFFDTKYAYVYNSGFNEWIPGTTWASTDSDFFWCANYRGVTDADRLFFATNFVATAANPMRYSDGATWTTFAPQLDAVPNYLFSARILVPYYGRLVALNCWEGPVIAGVSQYFNRARFSQIGSPVAADAFRTDLFGKGGFLDAPTNEEIIGAAFIKNTLIVTFERSTWQLRYVGEYGLPFIWERISSDFGADSTFSSITFNNAALSVGDKAITASSATDVQRIDDQIPDLVYDFSNNNNGVKRVCGIRDFQRELVFWCYPDAKFQGTFPNQVLVYNYRNESYSIFRDNVTFFGTFQLPDVLVTLWDSTSVLWNDEEVTWGDVQDVKAFPKIVSGNQEGYIHFYGYGTPDEYSLTISAIDRTVSPLRLTIPNHNLAVEEVIFVSGILFIDTTTSTPVATDLNDQIYVVLGVVDANTIQLGKWNGTSYVGDFSYTPSSPTGTYVGNGKVALYPRVNMMTKDFSPYISQGLQSKASYFDFLMSATPAAKMTVNVYVNTSLAAQANLLVGNQEVETYLPSPYYVPDSDISWHRLFATLNGQFFSLQITYDDILMNEEETHESILEMHAIVLYARTGGKNTF